MPAPRPSRPAKDPRALFGLVTALTAIVIGTVRGVVWGLEDRSRIPLILAGLLLLAAVAIGGRWWVKHREREAAERRAEGKAAPRARRTCRCGQPLDGVAPGPVSIDGLNVVRVTCPACGRIAGA
jgi:hypothetical protein